MKPYNYIKWKCPECGDIVISNKFRHHQMDVCSCGKSGVDLETYMIRGCGKPMTLEYIDYNFFDELVICMREQDLLIPTILERGHFYIDLLDVLFIQKIEDEILEGMK